jgi:hypothetical protein
MDKMEKVEPHKARISKEIFGKWNGVVRVQNSPKSAVEGAEVADKIRKLTEVTVVEEQKDVSGSEVQRVKTTYGEGREGWVVSDAISVIIAC